MSKEPESSVIGRLLDNAASKDTKPLDLHLKDFHITSFNRTREVQPLNSVHTLSFGQPIEYVPMPKPKSVSGTLTVCDGITETSLTFAAGSLGLLQCIPDHSADKTGKMSLLDSLKKKIEDFRLT